jgi:hypothetical protein
VTATAAVDEGHSLELTWLEQEQESVLRLEIVPRETGCLLVLDHSRLAGAARIGFGAGWQAHLEALDALLSGGPDLDWWARYEELRPGYEAREAGGASRAGARTS